MYYFSGLFKWQSVKFIKTDSTLYLIRLKQTMADQTMANLVAVVHGRAVNAVIKGTDTTECISHLISIDCPLCMKYKVLDIVTLIKENGSVS